MPGDTRNLEIRFRATDQATPVINRISSELTGLQIGTRMTGAKMTTAISGVSGALRVMAGITGGLAVGALVEFGRSLFSASENTEKLQESLDGLALRISTLPFDDAKKKLESLTQSTGTTIFGLIPRSFGDEAQVKNIEAISKAVDGLFKSIEEARVDPLSKAAVAFKELQKARLDVGPEDSQGRIKKLSDILVQLNFAAKQSSKQLQELVSTILGPAGPEFIKAAQSAEDFTSELQALSKVEDQLPKGFKFVSQMLKEQRDALKAQIDLEKKLKEEQKSRAEAAAKEHEAQLHRESTLRSVAGLTVSRLSEIQKKANFDALDDLQKINALYDEQVKSVKDIALVSGLNKDEQQGVNDAVRDTIASLEFLKQKQIADLPKKKAEKEQPEKLDATRRRLKDLTEEVDDGLNAALLTTVEIVGTSLVHAFDLLFEKGLSTAEKIRSVLNGIARDISQTLLSIGIKAGITALFAAAGSNTGGGVGPADTSIPTGQTDIQAAAHGGIFPGGTFLPMQAFASGGVVNKPTLGLIGEGGDPELVVPIKGGKVPVQKVGRGRNEGMVINLNVSATDSKSFEDMLARPGARRMIRDSIREMTASDRPYRSQIRSI